MKIAVCSENGNVFQHFGHTPEFLVYNVEDGKVVKEDILSSNGIGHGALAGLLADESVDTLICGGIGGGAIAALGQAGIKAIGGVEGSSRAAVDAYLAGTLAPKADFMCHHHSHEDGRSCSAHYHDHSCGGGCHTEA